VLLPELPSISVFNHPGGLAFGSFDDLEHFVTEIEPFVAEPNHRLLNVLFTKDVNSPEAPQVSKISTTTENMVGADIRTTDEHWVVLFSSNPDITIPVTSAVIEADVNGVGFYRLFGMIPGGDYAVDVIPSPGGHRITVKPGNALQASANGVLQFHIDKGGVARDPEEAAAAAMQVTSQPQLYQNHPNPFNPATMISFSLPTARDVRLTIVDVRGRIVRTLVDRSLGAGRHHVEWEGRDGRGTPVSSGIYFYRLDAGGETITRKMVLLK
jgi:hypothetical protein